MWAYSGLMASMSLHLGSLAVPEVMRRGIRALRALLFQNYQCGVSISKCQKLIRNKDNVAHVTSYIIWYALYPSVDKTYKNLL